MFEDDRAVQLDYLPTDIVEVMNPTSEDFHYTVGNSQSVSNGISRNQSHTIDEYVVPAGGTVKMEGYKADIYIKKIVDQLMQDNSKTLSLGIKEARLAYEEKIYVGKLHTNILTAKDTEKVDQIMQESTPDDQQIKSGSGDLPLGAAQSGETELEAFPEVTQAPKVNTAKKK